MKGAPGIRTPGISLEVAHPSAIRQWTRKGSVNTSRRKPRPGTIALNALGCAMMSVKLDFKKVPDSRPFHQHRTGQRMNKPRLDGGEVRRGHTRLDLPVKCIAGFQGDLFALVNLSNWGDVGVITVVAEVGLFGQRFASIDADRVHACLTMVQLSESTRRNERRRQSMTRRPSLPDIRRRRRSGARLPGAAVARVGRSPITTAEIAVDDGNLGRSAL